MSLYALIGATEIGLVYALVALGVMITFRLLDFPDLTVDGTFPLGAAVAAACLVRQAPPALALAAGAAAGALAGSVTGILATRFRIQGLLAGILTMIALYSINIRIMGGPNVPLLDAPSLASPLLALGWREALARPAILAAIVGLVIAALATYLAADLGLALRATGANPRMARAQGIGTGRQIVAGLALSNALVALAGALFAAVSGFADVSIGTGTIVIGLAAVILGEALYHGRALIPRLMAVALGAVLYRLAVALALEGGGLGLEPSDLNLITAVLVGAALMAARLRLWRAGAA